ncbi:Hypothetical protein SCLAV_3816 [Streptomyces clavuligerus]|uniref:Secreted protein n=2 Tax=Streptomyces clavuligerus TaxID=1901 RepID=E2Q3H3_STRCL|nr:Hypothetical protein SCLAV_3816 [Streptomyces clavuligerus]
MAAVAAALGAGGTAAHAATATASGSPLDTVGAALGGTPLAGPATGGLGGVVTNSVTGVDQLTKLQLNPLAKTGVDPLANGVAAQVADFKPVSTEVATGPLAQGASAAELPLVGGVVQALPL